MTRAGRVLEARRRLKAGKFDRAVTANAPHDLLFDKLTLECGHWTAWNKDMHADPTPPARMACHECAQDWIKAAEEES